MKTYGHFVAVEDPKPKKGRHHFRIFKCTNKGLRYLCSGEIYYGSTRGTESEVMNALSSQGFIPKRFTKYYSDHFTDQGHPIQIQYFAPRN